MARRSRRHQAMDDPGSAVRNQVIRSLVNVKEYRTGEDWTNWLCYFNKVAEINK